MTHAHQRPFPNTDRRQPRPLNLLISLYAERSKIEEGRASLLFWLGWRVCGGGGDSGGAAHGRLETVKDGSQACKQEGGKEREGGRRSLGKSEGGGGRGGGILRTPVEKL